MNQNQLKEYISLSSIPIRRIKSDGMPNGIASACIINYEGKHIVLTVHHATGDMHNWGIQVKYEPTKGTLIKPLGSMNFLKSLDLNTNISSDIDFAYVEIPVDIEPLSQEIDAKSGSIINERQRLVLKVNFNMTPDVNESYGFSGQIMPEIDRNVLITELRTYTGLKYVGNEGDFYAFELPSKHPGHDHFKGCSGAPIIDTKGNAIALVCNGDTSTNRVYGISLARYEIAINAIYGELSKIT